MDPIQQAAFIIAQSACALGELAAMQAANQLRARNNEAPAYSEDDFNALSERYVIGHNSVISFFQGGR